MNESDLKATLAQLIARVEELQTENTTLRAQNAECGKAVARLVEKVENLQSVQAEHKVKVHASAPASYRKRPPVMRGRTVQTNVGCGPLYITLNEDAEGKPFEVFFKLGKSGSCQQSYLEALGVAMSVGLRYGADPQKFVEKFEGMRCPNPKMRGADGPTTLSCADGISQGLANALTLAFPLDQPSDARGEADVVAVAEPKYPVTEAEARENEANAKSIDLIASLPLVDLAGGSAPSIGNGIGGYASALSTMTELPQPNLRKAMMAGVGMCPKCGGNLISQGGCIQCLQECGYVGKCS
jgi:hypothetical protein